MTNAEISGLKEEARVSILHGDIRKADAAQKKYEEKLKQKEEEMFKNCQKKAEISLKSIIKNYKENLEIINSSFYDIEISVRQRSDLSFQNAQAIHIRQLIRLEKSFAVERMRAQKRLVKDSQLYQKQVQSFIKLGDQEAAEYAKQNADESKEKELNRRIEDINKDFDAQRKIIFDKQKNELRILDEKLVNNLAQVEKTKQIQMESQQNQLKVSVLSSIHKIIEKIPINSVTRKQKAAISKALHSYAQDYIHKALNLQLNLTNKADPVSVNGSETT